MARQKVQEHFTKGCKVHLLWNFRWSPFIKKIFLSLSEEKKIAINWKEGNVMRLLSFERMINVGALSPNLSLLWGFFKHVQLVWKWRETGHFVDKLLQIYFSWLKDPVALSIFIYLIPPTKAHQQSPRYILRMMREFNDALNTFKHAFLF